MKISLRHERGFLLIAVLVITVLASMVALSLLFRMRAEQAAFAASAGSEQAWFVAISGVHQAMQLAKARAEDPATWQNNPAAFKHYQVLDDGSDRWYFTVFTPAPPEEETIRYGITDETRKLNLNKATAEMLGKATVLSPQQIDTTADVHLERGRGLAAFFHRRRIRARP